MSAKVMQWDIHARDAVAQRRFYSEVVGWQCSDPDTPDHYGWMVDGDRRTLGGIGQANEGESPGAAIFVQVDDVQAVLDRAKDLGGDVCWGPVTAVSDMVTGCISDPEGNGVLLIKPSSEGGPYSTRPPVEVNSWTWDIQSQDPESLADFYSALFDWTWTGSGDNGWGPLITGPGNGPGGGITRSDSTGFVIAIRVVDLTETAGAFERLGGSILAPPRQLSENLSIATCVDPEGNQIGLYQLAQLPAEDEVRTDPQQSS